MSSNCLACQAAGAAERLAPARRTASRGSPPRDLAGTGGQGRATIVEPRMRLGAACWGRAGSDDGRGVVELKTPGEIEAIRAAGVVVAEVLGTARATAAPGITLKELDEAARGVLKKAGATSPFLNYKPRFAPIPYPAVICTSVNDAALHGIPGGYRLAPAS